uniref:Com family DNA-binding transcriptional regulator n=1 Tax=uncultured Bilophila sp. TaxID=529385 RepID=UPI00345C381D
MDAGAQGKDNQKMTGVHQDNEIRCGHCNKMLAKGTALDLSIKCPRCGTINTMRATRPGSEPRDGHAEQSFCK